MSHVPIRLYLNIRPFWSEAMHPTSSKGYHLAYMLYSIIHEYWLKKCLRQKLYNVFIWIKQWYLLPNQSATSGFFKMAATIPPRSRKKAECQVSPNWHVWHMSIFFRQPFSSTKPPNCFMWEIALMTMSKSVTRAINHLWLITSCRWGGYRGGLRSGMHPPLQAWRPPVALFGAQTETELKTRRRAGSSPAWPPSCNMDPNSRLVISLWS